MNSSVRLAPDWHRWIVGVADEQSAAQDVADLASPMLAPGTDRIVVGHLERGRFVETLASTPGVAGVGYVAG